MKNKISLFILLIGLTLVLMPSCKKVADEIIGTWDVMTFNTSPEGTIQITFDNDTHVLVRASARQGTVLSNAKYYPMLRLASDTDPTYVPYNGYQVTVNLGGTYYSGILDVVSGVLTVDKVGVDLGTLTWTYNNTNFVATDITGGVTKSGKTCICSCYATVNNVQYSTDIIADHSICMSTLTANRLYVHDSGYSDVATFKTAVTGQKVVYELATPQSIQLSPTMVKALVGENHLSAPLDGQEITESKYKQAFTFDDVIAYIQSLS